MAASAQGHAQLVDLLCTRGEASLAAVNIHDSNGCTALVGACYGGYTAVVKRLLRSGAQVKNWRFDALQITEAEGHTERSAMVREHMGLRAQLRLLATARTQAKALHRNQTYSTVLTTNETVYLYSR